MKADLSLLPIFYIAYFGFSFPFLVLGAVNFIIFWVRHFSETALCNAIMNRAVFKHLKLVKRHFFLKTLINSLSILSKLLFHSVCFAPNFNFLNPLSICFKMLYSNNVMLDLLIYENTDYK